MANPIAVILDRIEGDIAVLRLPDGDEVTLPAKILPAEQQEGMVLNLSLTTDKEGEAARQQQVRQLLNDILKTN